MPSQLANLLPVTDPVSGPWGLMALLLYATFVLHLLVMNALVGMALIALFDRLRPAASPVSLYANHNRDTDVLLPKGVAFTVNLGVPPFLFLQTIYGQYIYSSSVLMGMWWLSVMLVVMLAYFGFYLNMAHRTLPEAARTTALALATLLLLWNAFLFVNNMTLAQNPQIWTHYAHQAGGLLLNLGDPQLAPRYLHVLLACLAAGGLCMALPAALALRKCGETARGGLEKLRTRGLNIFAGATLLQLPVGAWFLLALPREQQMIFMGKDAPATALFALSLLLTGAALFAALRRKTVPAALGGVLLVALMAGMRSLLRLSYLEGLYNPPMRAPDIGPLLLFVVSLAASAAGLIWLLRLYFKTNGRDTAAGPENGSAPRGEELRDLVLVNEIARTRRDRDVDLAEEQGGAKA